VRAAGGGDEPAIAPPLRFQVVAEPHLHAVDERRGVPLQRLGRNLKEEKEEARIHLDERIMTGGVGGQDHVGGQRRLTSRKCASDELSIRSDSSTSSSVPVAEARRGGQSEERCCGGVDTWP